MVFEMNRVALGLAFPRAMGVSPATYHSASIISLVRGWYIRANYKAAQIHFSPTTAATTTTCICNLLEMREIGDYNCLLFSFYTSFCYGCNAG
jgi:hypothetical protein